MNSLLGAAILAITLGPVQKLGSGFHDVTPTFQKSNYLGVLGWSKDGRHFAFDTENGDMSARSEFTRTIVNVPQNRVVKEFKVFDEEWPAAIAQLRARSAALLKKLGIQGTNVGRVLYSVAGPPFPEERLPRVSELRTQFTFEHRGKTKVLRLTNRFSDRDMMKDIEGKPGYYRANFTLTLHSGTRTQTLQSDKDFRRPTLIYGISRVMLSPDRKSIAVILRNYTGLFHEGWNVAAEHLAVTAKLR